jgi:hypothetical protein
MGRANIKDDGKRFSKDYQPANRGRPKGAKSRSTILKKWLEAKTDITNPITKLKQKGTVEDEVILALITKARKGDVAAAREILDTMYGKLKDKTEHSFDLSELSDEEIILLERITAKLTK